MAAKSFKFISPGIFIDEIDNSELPALPDEIGPVIIGRTERGPGMRPIKVGSFSEFVQIFGNPTPGGQGGDVWRDGNYLAPTYAAYAAQAYLRNSNAVTMVRVLGAQATSATNAGKAGWTPGTKATPKVNTTINATNGGAYGFWGFPSGSSPLAAGQIMTGALGAVWYLNEGAIVLSGTMRDADPDGANGTIGTGSATLIRSLDTTTPVGTSTYAGALKNEWYAIIYDADGNVQKETAFNFTPSSSKYIRKVFNTNPTLVNTAITNTNQQETYWLGGSFERHLATYVTGANAGEAWGAILGIASGSEYGADFRMAFQAAQTPWIISQDLQSSFSSYDVLGTSRVKQLFKFHTLDAGEDEMKKLKISISDIKVASNDFDSYGSFSVELRDARDNDLAPVVLERFSSVNLNPNSMRYIARVIGDQYLSWDDTERRHRLYGNYLNASKYVRVEMNSDVDAGATDSRYLPFGSYGPLRPNAWTYISSSSPTNPDASGQNNWVFGGTKIPGQEFEQIGTKPFMNMSGGADNTVSDKDATDGAPGSLKGWFPGIPLRQSASDGGVSNPKDAYFGMDSTQASNNRHEDSYGDILYPMPVGGDSFTKAGGTEYSYLFSLDDVSASTNGNAAGVGVWVSGSRFDGNSYTAVSGAYTEVLDVGFNRFTVPLYGGFNGLDVMDKEPFNNTDLGTNSTDNSNYGYYSLRRAIDTVSDPELVEYNLMAAPGIWNEGITAHMIDVCEARGDSLAVIDIDTGFYAETENTNSVASNLGSVSTAVTNLRNRKINSSYGCAYYPWVQLRDTINNSLLWAPPSIVALGTFSSAQKKSELWFAPAGFTRGGLTEGSAGLPVIQTRERLTSKNRDDLYEVNINPIATFPAEGIVIFGQKTLQVTPSALDRINVRRLMIYVKKEISRMAATILFDQNVQATWDRFLNKVNPFLRSVQARLGLTDFKVILDETTTTPELIDRNILYAKIFLKPARAIEFIALDFVITNTGASFED
tara:strand:+ start:608 stop:3586 length:2979 start_codon:yes stop_codon:yes gene_type:complete